jgi:hypothetical protein
MDSIVKLNEWKGWTAITIGSDLQHLEELYKEGESLFEQKLIQFEIDFSDKTKYLSKVQKDEYGAYVSDEYWKLSEIFPQIFRSSFLIICFSRLEYELKELCDSIYQYNKSYNEPNFTKDIILNCMNYLVREVKIDKTIFRKEWNNILVYKKIRNRLAHNDGMIKLSDKKHIESFFKRFPQIGKLNDFKIILHADFCNKVIRDINWQLMTIYEYMRKNKIKTPIISILG